jgi:hypothetical protein
MLLPNRGRHPIFLSLVAGWVCTIALAFSLVGNSVPTQPRNLKSATFFLNKVLRYSIAYDLELTAAPGALNETYALPTGPRARKGFYRIGADGSAVNEIDDVYWLNATKRIRNDVWERLEANDKILTYSAVNKELDDSGSSQIIEFNFESGECRISIEEQHYDVLFGSSQSRGLRTLRCELE